jgi:hypothetical protein
MKGKTLVSALVLAVIVCGSQMMGLGCAQDKGRGSDDMGYTGSRLIIDITSANEVEVDAFLSVCSVTGSTIKYEDGLTNEYFDAEIHLEGGSPNGNSQTGYHLTSYDVSCSSSDPGAVMPFVHNGISVSYWVGPGSDLTTSDLLLVTAEDKLNFSLIGSPILEPVYNCTITFYGENEYGYEFTEEAYLWMTVTDWNRC